MIWQNKIIELDSILLRHEVTKTEDKFLQRKIWDSFS